MVSRVELACEARTPEPFETPLAEGNLEVDPDEILKFRSSIVDPGQLKNCPGATLDMRQSLEFYYQKIVHATKLYDPKGSLVLLSLVNRQIFVAYDLRELSFPGHCDVM